MSTFLLAAMRYRDSAISPLDVAIGLAGGLFVAVVVIALMDGFIDRTLTAHFKRQVEKRRGELRM